MLKRPLALVVGVLAVVLTATAAFADFAAIWTSLAKNSQFHASTVASDGNVFWARTQGRGIYLERNAGDDGGRDWRKKIGNSSKLEVQAVAAAPDASFVLIGGADGPPGSEGRAPWVARHTADKGRRVWATQIDEIVAGAVAGIAVAADGDSVYVAGTYTPLPVSGDENVFVARLDADGNVLWVKTFDGDVTDFANSIAVDPKGTSVFVGGASGDTQGPTALDTLLLKYDADGDLAWSKRGDRTGGIDVIRSIAVSANGKKIYAAGITDASDDFGSRDLFFQQFKSGNGKSGPWQVHDLVGGFEVVGTMAIAPGGRTMFIAASGCPADGGACHGFLVQTSNKGKLQDQQAVVSDLSQGGTGLTHVSVDPNGDIVVGGSTEAGEALLRKLTR